MTMEAQAAVAAAQWRARWARIANGGRILAESVELAELRELLAALQAMKVGDFSVRLPGIEPA